MNGIAEYGVPPQSGVPKKDRIVATLFWLEWRRHRLGLVLALGFLVPTMIVCAAIEEAREGIFFWLAFAMAWGTGLGVGRVEWLEGEEEFQLSLPATRAQRYRVKFCAGALILAGFYAIGVATCFTEWFSSLGDLLDMKRYGTEDLPFYLGRGPAFVSFALVFPLAAYVEFFALSITTSRRGDAVGVVRAVLFVAAALAVAVGAARWLGESAGWLHAPLWIAYAVWRAWSGERAYSKKDAVLDVQSAGAPERQVVLVTAGLLLAAGLALGLLILYRSR